MKALGEKEHLARQAPKPKISQSRVIDIKRNILFVNFSKTEIDHLSQHIKKF
jgi:hypothetical protein